MCLGKDIPPLNRLVRCMQCASLYHQSCHTPALIKSILEEAGENWTCRMCKQRGVPNGTTTGLTKGKNTNGLIVTLKRANYDEKALEETVMTNKSSFSNLLQRHAEWKSPGKKDGQSLTVRLTDVNFRNEKVSTVDEKSSLHSTAGLSIPSSQKSEQTAAAKVSQSDGKAKHRSSTRPDAKHHRPTMSRTAVSKSSVPTPADLESSLDVTFQNVSLGEAVPSIKPPSKAIPASQTSDLSLPSSNLTNFESTSPPTTRAHTRIHNKRNQVINDSEEEGHSAKRAKTLISPRAATKSASTIRPQFPKQAPLKLPLMSGSSGNSTKLARKGVVAKKSGTLLRGSEASEPTMSMNKKGKGIERDLRSPISPIQSARQVSPQPSSLPAIRPADRWASQQFSLQLILSKGASRNEKLLVDNESTGFDYSTPYPATLSCVRRPSTAAAQLFKERSRDKNNFDILSLVPDAAVPVLEDGKLAFREGSFDIRTGHLKRGARKFKVGRVIPGELL